MNKFTLAAAAIVILAGSATVTAGSARIMTGSAEFTADANPPLAGQVLVSGRPNSINDGGEFRIEVVGGAGLAAVGFHAGRVFNTFCMELDEPIDVGDTYDVYINTVVYGGGTNAGGGMGFAGDGDPLSAQTAYLFTQFWNGTLNNYEFGETSTGSTTNGLTRAETARALQLAIWVLEGEIADLNSGGVDSPNEAAIRALAQGYLDEANGSGWTTIRNVRVLNMGPNAVNQDVLIVIPLPQAGALAALGIGGLAIRRRRSVL